MTPPPDIGERAAKFHLHSPAERKRTLEFISENPQGLRRSLAQWLKALNDTGTISSRTINNMLFCQRGARISEFIALFGASSLSSAVELALQFSTKASEDDTEQQPGESLAPQATGDMPQHENQNVDADTTETQICEEEKEKVTSSKVQDVFAIPKRSQDVAPPHHESPDGAEKRGK